MPLLRINACDRRAVLADGGDLDEVIAGLVAELPDFAPVVILVHGYKFSPFRHGTDPHRHILSLRPDPDCWKAVSWPRHLGFGRYGAEEGLCIAFGWEARGSIWSAWRRAARAGHALTDLCRRLQRLHPRPVDVMCHSLGARVVLRAMRRLPRNSVGRAVLLAAAEFQETARLALASPAGRSAEVINVTSRENDLFDVLCKCLLRPHKGSSALGKGLGAEAPNWLDVRIDRAEVRAALAAHGYRVPAPERRVCHWSSYLRPGLFPFYRDLIRDRDALPLALLRRSQPAPAPRGLDQMLDKGAATLSAAILPARSSATGGPSR